MWDMRRHLDPKPMPRRKLTIVITYPDQPEAKRHWWLIIDEGQVDLCSVDPGFDVDLHVETELRTMTAIWMGLATLRAEVGAGRVEVSGDRELIRSMDAWLGLSPFAKERNRRSAAA